MDKLLESIISFDEARMILLSLKEKCNRGFNVKKEADLYVALCHKWSGLI